MAVSNGRGAIRGPLVIEPVGRGSSVLLRRGGGAPLKGAVAACGILRENAGHAQAYVESPPRSFRQTNTPMASPLGATRDYDQRHAVAHGVRLNVGKQTLHGRLVERASSQPPPSPAVRQEVKKPSLAAPGRTATSSRSTPSSVMSCSTVSSSIRSRRRRSSSRAGGGSTTACGRTAHWGNVRRRPRRSSGRASHWRTTAPRRSHRR